MQQQSEAERIIELQEWVDGWEQGDTGFHTPTVHKLLETHLDKVLKGRKGVRFFFPLCGKAVDMKWLADKGHSVVGVEISEKGIREFFEENKLKYSEEPVKDIPGAKVYRSEDKAISLYQCDLYSFSSSTEGQFGAIWDRGSFGSINLRDQAKYIPLIQSLMANDCTYLLVTFLYDTTVHKGPPFSFSKEQVQSLFGDTCNVELLQGGTPTEEEEFPEVLYLLTLKNK
ncbi:putative thiopurine S-methyltransferase [Pholidichthys leucotaenia]